MSEEHLRGQSMCCILPTRVGNLHDQVLLLRSNGSHCLNTLSNNGNIGNVGTYCRATMTSNRIRAIKSYVM
jgi:hypothetical protein